MFQIRRMFFKSGNKSQSYHKSFGTAVATFLNFYVSYSSATRLSRNGDKYYIL